MTALPGVALSSGTARKLAPRPFPADPTPASQDWSTEPDWLQDLNATIRDHLDRSYYSDPTAAAAIGNLMRAKRGGRHRTADRRRKR